MSIYFGDTTDEELISELQQRDFVVIKRSFLEEKGTIYEAHLEQLLTTCKEDAIKLEKHVKGLMKAAYYDGYTDREKELRKEQP